MTRKLGMSFERSLSWGVRSWWGPPCWWILRLRYKWDETAWYIRPFRIWWHSEHLAKWFGKKIVITADGIDVGHEMRTLNLGPFGIHIWTNY